jgi:hypothetical protein
MSLNLVSRLALAFGALTIATLPAFAETSEVSAPAPAAVAASPAVPAIPSADAGKTAVKHHVRKSAEHHKKAVKKEAVEKTGLTDIKPATPAEAPAAAAPKL